MNPSVNDGWTVQSLTTESDVQDKVCAQAGTYDIAVSEKQGGDGRSEKRIMVRQKTDAAWENVVGTGCTRFTMFVQSGEILIH